MKSRKVDHHSLSDYETQLAQVLAQRGADIEAEELYRRSIADALAQSSEESSSSVGIARHFFAAFLVSRRRGDDALEALGPALAHAKSLEGVLRLVEAEALWTLGRQESAREAATRALALAANEDQRQRMRDRLVRLDGWVGDV